MKRLNSLLLTMCMSVFLAFAGTGTSASDAIDFDWAAGNEHPGNNETVWYKVDLSAVPEGDDVLLYLNNLSTSITANIEAEPFIMLGSLTSLNEPTSKAILPTKNYAMNMSGSTIEALNVSEVYIALKSDNPVKFAAEPVEPGEKDLECMNAPQFNYAGTTQTASSKWYVVDITEAKSNPAKTVEITITNLGAATANIDASVSFDCPSSGLTSNNMKVAAGATQTKKLDRAFLDMVSSNEVYVKLTTDQKITLKANVVDAEVQPAKTVGTAIDFALETEYNLAYGEQWYKVPVASLTDGKKLAELTLSNTSTNTANITAEVVLTETYTSSMSRYINLGANQVLVKELARNLIKQIPTGTDYIWVKLNTNTNITFSARLKKRIEGNACKNAKVFDWNTGAWQNKETTLWYAIPIKDAKATANNDKDIQLTIENLGSTTATIQASMAFECPCSATTDATRTIAAGATQTKVVERGMYANLASDTIFVGVTTTQNIRISAELVPTTATPNDCDLAKAINFDLKNGHKQLAANGKQWYKIDILPILTMRDTVPEIVVTNLGAAQATIDSEIAFECPGINAGTRSTTLAAGGTITKAITRDMLESLDENIQYVYISVNSNQDIQIKVNLKKENEGLSCMTGKDFAWNSGYTQKAGQTMWYKIDLTTIKNNPGTAATIGIVNKNGKAGNVKATIYANCDAEAMETYSATLGASAAQEKNIEYATIASLKPDTIYIQLYTAEDDSIYANLYMEPAITPITACDGAIPMEYNTDIAQAAGEKWYAVSVKYLQNFTSGDATLTVTNTSATTAEIKAEVAFECPVTTQMTERIITLAAGEKHVNVAERQQINNLGVDSAWIRVTANQDITFRVDISDKRGETCSSPIFYDWVNGNTNPADQTLWYYVELDTLRNSPDKDMQLNVTNLTTNSVSASAAIFFECGGEEFQSFSYDFAPSEAKYKVIDRNFMEQMGWPQMFIKLTSTNGDVHLKAELVDALPTQRDTLILDTIVCKGIDNFVTYTGLTYVIDKDTTLVDSVRYTYTDGPLTLLGDSIIIHKVRVKHTPYVVPLNKFALTNAPVVVAGQAIDVTATTTALMNEFKAYTSADSIFAEVTEIKWQIHNPAINNYVPLKNDLLDTKTTQVTLRYQFVTDCESSGTSKEFTFSAAEPLRETKTITDIVCEETTIKGRLGNVVIKADTTWNDTVFNLTHNATTLKDSIYVYEYKVWKQPTVPAWGDLSSTINAQAGLALDVTATTNELKTLTGSPATDVLAVNDIVWEQKAEDGTFAALSVNPLAYDLKDLTIRYGLVLDAKCGVATLYGEEKTFTVNPADTTVIPVADTVCVGTSYHPVFGNDVTINADTTWTEFEYLNDKINQYDFSLVTWKQPVVPAWTELTTIVAQAGLALDVTAADADLQAAIANNAAADVLTVNSILWEQKDENGTYKALSTDPLAYDLKELTIRYSLVVDAKCGDLTLYGTDNILAVNPADTITEVTLDTVCAGTLYDATHGDDVTINKDEVWTVFEYNAATIYRYDYDIKVYVEPVLAQYTIAPEAVCGDTLHIKATGDEIMQLTEASLTDLHMTITNSGWELKQADGTFAPYNNEVSAPDQVSVIRYAAETSCGTTIYSQEITLTAKTPTADNFTEYANIEAINKYDWLLMVNVKALNDKGYSFTEEDVKWYKVVNTVDNVEDVLNATGDDEYTGKTGFYYTIGESFNGSGDYYAVINIPQTEGANICGGQMRSQVIVFSGKKAPAKIALKSNILTTGEEVVVYGLGQDEEAVISIYDMMGQILYQTKVQGQSAYTLPGVNRQGCYMVGVTRQQKKDALKFVVK